ncbi:MAG: prepilin-type N-terminal cleavage/methylation domain-containing protein [Eubacteriales bacterium]|jgi:general secretion pathway protein G
MLKILRNKKGFTMIEMMVVLIIIAVLVGAGIKFYSGYIGKAKIDKAKADISTMQAAVDSYYAENGYYPGDGTGDSLASFGLSTLIVGTLGETKTYVYDDISATTYKLFTRVKVDGKYHVMGVGTDGASEKAVPVEATS